MIDTATMVGKSKVAQRAGVDKRAPARKRFILGGALVLSAAGLGLAGWWLLQPKGLEPGFASGNGRIEAVEIDVAAKTPGRLDDILVNEGDFVTRGQIVARMDTRVLTLASG